MLVTQLERALKFWREGDAAYGNVAWWSFERLRVQLHEERPESEPFIAIVNEAVNKGVLDAAISIVETQIRPLYAEPLAAMAA